MDRRKFLKVGAAGAGAVAAGNVVSYAKETEKVKPASETVAVDGYVSEPAREIPVVAKCDVLVAGGGPAGFAASLSAARQGANVIVLEKGGFLGGLWTGCAVLPLNCMGANVAGEWKQVVYGYAHELNKRLEDIDMSIMDRRSPVVDPEATKYMMQVMLQETGVKVLYYVQAAALEMSGDRIESIIVESKSGRCAVKAKTVVDATGDGDIFYWAGDPFRHVKHHIGAMWRVGNIKEDTDLKRRPTPIPGVRLMHTNGEYDQDGLDLFNLSRLTEAMREHCWKKTQELRGVRGCEDAYVVDTPTLVGVRVTRVLESLCDVGLDSVMTDRVYDDVIGIAGVDIGINYEGNKYKVENRHPWQIPFRALVPKKTANLVVAGRCFGYGEGITYDAREIATCLVTGQAAGAAAARAVLERSSIREVDIKKLQKTLREQDVRLD
ncbi:MAG: FAD-dependent oxidoreductase [Bacteroidales bacterium]|nr:FAD-dependent oxidoreductase [Bacteroidales bacterium]